MASQFINADLGFLPHKDGQNCTSCNSNVPGTVLKPMYEKTPDGCVPFWRVVAVRADGKLECKGDVTVGLNAGYDVQDESLVCSGYLPAPSKEEVVVPIVKQYKTASATFAGSLDGPVVVTEVDLGIPAGSLVTNISLSAVGTNANGITIKGGCGPDGCSLVNLEPNDSISWGHAEGLSGSLFEATILPDTPGSTLRDMLEVSYILCSEV